MSCEECEKYTEEMDRIAYYRWKTANIGLVGCPTHLREIMDVLNDFQAKEKQRK